MYYCLEGIKKLFLILFTKRNCFDNGLNAQNAEKVITYLQKQEIIIY